MKTREQIIAENPLDRRMEQDGVKLIKTATGWKCKCPFHEDKNPSMSIDSSQGIFHCHGCKAGGSVIDYVLRKTGLSLKDVMKQLGGEDAKPFRKVEAVKPRGVEVAAYTYRDEQGQELYQAVRFEPKDFLQRHKAGDNWIWGMKGVRLVLYNLQIILRANSPYVWVVEGEKDADSLKKCGLVATTNIGGAGKWLDGYSESLKGKEVILCGDNDDPGRAHMAKVLEAIAKVAKTVRQVTIPAPHKDVSDFIATFNGDNEAAAKALFEMFESAAVLTGGVLVPVQSMAELEAEYREFIKDCKTCLLDLGKWIPQLNGHVRGLVPGELVSILADTGVGKTAFLQNLAISASPIPTLLFELELPGTLTFERFVSMSTQTNSRNVFSQYSAGQSVDWKTDGALDHISVCSKSRLTPEQIEKIIIQTELKTGTRPRLVLLDYVGLVQGSGKTRYERVSNVAEELKVVAKSTKTIIVMASQVSRGDNGGPEISLNDGKDSGSIENSSGLVLGIWRDDRDAKLLKVKILKNTKGRPGLIVTCDFDGETMKITNEAKVDREDVPAYH